MAMHQGLDLSRFKKVSSDRKCTVLRHERGHEIRIAHSGITPKMREQLEALEMHDSGKVKRKRMAEGGNPGDAQAPLDDQSPAVADNTPPDAPQEPAPANPAPTPADQTAPADAASSATAALPMDQQLKAESDLYNQDLVSGKIKPETYSDLFAKKDTLGKIGTLFGLLVSGAGSGLAHQPNAVMGMMQTEINNDLDAQKASAANAQNFYRLNLQHQMQNAQIQQMQTQNALTQAQTGAIPSEIALREAQAKGATADAGLKAWTLAQTQANSTAFHSLVTQVQKLPVGSPERANAEQKLAILGSMIQGENYNIIDRAAAASALSNVVTGSGNPANQPSIEMNPQASEQKFQQDQTLLRLSGKKELADDREVKHLPGVPGQASVPLTADDRNKIQTGQALIGSLQRLKDFANQYGNSVDPRVINAGKALGAQVQGDFRLATQGGVYKQTEQNFIDQVVPGDPTKFIPSVRVIPQIDSVIKETQARTNQFLQSKGFSVPQTPGNQPSNTRMFTNKGGGSVPYVRTKNGWQRQKETVGQK